MYPVLKAAMKKKKITMQDVADTCNITIQSVYNKMSGRSGWTLDECNAIKKKVSFIDSIDILFFNPKRSRN